MTTSQKIIEYIEGHGQVTGAELTDYLDITDRAVRKQLKALLDCGKVVKTGIPPKVYYAVRSKTIPIQKTENQLRSIDKNIQNIIIDNFLYVTPRGVILEGLEGFSVWCQERKLDPITTANTYKYTLDKYRKYTEHGLIDGMYKMKSTFDDVALDNLFYIDFYSIEIFGKTKL